MRMSSASASLSTRSPPMGSSDHAMRPLEPRRNVPMLGISEVLKIFPPRERRVSSRLLKCMALTCTSRFTRRFLCFFQAFSSPMALA